jgi:hypothetical protein
MATLCLTQARSRLESFPDLTSIHGNFGVALDAQNDLAAANAEDRNLQELVEPVCVSHDQ